jgi:hypothetical protein
MTTAASLPCATQTDADHAAIPKDVPRDEADAPIPDANAAPPSASADPGPLNDLVRRIHGGEVCPLTLPPEVRRQCVGYLTSEGFTNSEIAGLMRISERSVSRDRRAARRDEALSPGVHLGDELLGEFQQITLASVQRLVRLTRDTSASPYARLWAEEALVRNYQRFLESARKLNYLDDGAARLKKLLAPPPETPEQEAERTRKHYERQRLTMQAMHDGLFRSSARSKEEPRKAGRALKK